MTTTKKTTPKKKKDASFVIKLTLKSTELQKEYQEYLKEVQKTYSSKGFRTGNVPLDIVSKNVPQDKALQEITSHLISHLYSDEIKKQKLNPIIQPRVNLINPPLTIDKDLNIEITCSEKPILTLDPKYKAVVKKINSKPSKESTNTPNKLDEIFDKLISLSKVDIPKIIIEADLNSHFNSLIKQLQESNKSLEDFLKEKNQTIESYQKTLEDQIKKEWTLNLIIDKIAETEKITLKEDEVKNMIDSNPQLNNNPNLAYYLLQQQKVIKYLQSL